MNKLENHAFPYIHGQGDIAYCTRSVTLCIEHRMSSFQSQCPRSPDLTSLHLGKYKMNPSNLRRYNTGTYSCSDPRHVGALMATAEFSITGWVYAELQTEPY